MHVYAEESHAILERLAEEPRHVRSQLREPFRNHIERDFEIDFWCSSRSMAAIFTFGHSKPGVSASICSTRAVFSRSVQLTSSSASKGASSKTTYCRACHCARTTMTKTSGSRTQKHVRSRRADETHVVGDAWESPMRSTSAPRGPVSTSSMASLDTFGMVPMLRSS